MCGPEPRFVAGQKLYRVRTEPAVPNAMVVEETVANVLRESYGGNKYLLTDGRTVSEFDSYTSRERAVAELQCWLLREESRAKATLRQIEDVKGHLRDRGEWPPAG